MTDDALVTRMAAGDRSAYDELYRRYARAAFGLALRRLGDRERAVAAVRTLFSTAWQTATTADGSASAWLYGLAREHLGGSEEDWLDWRVHRSLELLPADEREAISLVYWSGLSPADVAEFLGRPPAVVQAACRSALERLEGALA